MAFHDPEVDRIREAMERADAARVRLADAIAISDAEAIVKTEWAMTVLLAPYRHPKEEQP